MIPELPPPQTFAEGQRLIYGWAIAGAGMFCGAVACGLIAILAWGGWPASLYGPIVSILGLTLGGFIIAMCFVIIGLLVGGPVGRFKASVSDGAKSASAEADAPGSDQ